VGVEMSVQDDVSDAEKAELLSGQFIIAPSRRQVDAPGFSPHQFGNYTIWLNKLSAIKLYTNKHLPQAVIIGTPIYDGKL
jgi:hypothetical protein